MAASSFYVYLLWVTLQVTHQYYFEPGYTHHYTYSSTTDTLGMHNVTTVIRVGWPGWKLLELAKTFEKIKN